MLTFIGNSKRRNSKSSHGEKLDLELTSSHRDVCGSFDRPSVVLSRDYAVPEWSWPVRVKLGHVL